MRRGRSQAAPMSAPESPTLVKRKAIFADSAATRMSEAAPHGEDEAAGEAGEVLQRLEVTPEQRPDDVLDVATRTECATGPSNDDGADAGLRVEALESVAQLLVHSERECIEPLRAGERDRGNLSLLVELVEERLREDAHSMATASISTSALESISDFTSTTAIAG